MGNLVHHIQSAFSGGELSPSLYARVDIQKYMSGLKTARNVCILPHGGVRNRPGTLYVKTAYGSGAAVRLIPFTVSSGQSYMLEFGDQYVRIYTNGAPVVPGANMGGWITGTLYYPGDYVEIGGAGHFTYYRCMVAHTSGIFADDETSGYWELSDGAYRIYSPYAAADLFDLKYVQSADYLYICHPGYPPQQLVRMSDTNWYFSELPNEKGPFKTSNTSLSKMITPSAITASEVQIDISYISLRNGRVFITCSGTHALVGTQNAVRFVSDGAAATTLNSAYFRAIPMDATHLELMHMGTSEYVTMAALTPYAPTAAMYYNDHITLTSNFSYFDGGMEGSLFQMNEDIPPSSVGATYNSGGAKTSGSLKCGRTWRFVTSGIWGGTGTVDVSIDGGTTWTTIHSFSGTFDSATDTGQNFDITGQTGYAQCLIRYTITITALSGTTMTAEVDSAGFTWSAYLRITSVLTDKTAYARIIDYPDLGKGLASTNALSEWAEGSWSAFNGYPAVCAFFQDRFIAASSDAEPQTLWFSQTSDYNNFGISNDTVIDTDAIYVVLNSRTINAVRNMASLISLLVMTSDADFSIAPSNGVLTPTTVEQVCHGHRGSSMATPVIVGNELILVQPMSSVVRNLIYQFMVQGYMGDNISIMSQHLLTGFSIVELAYQQEPDSMIWAVRSDGKLLSLTYLKEQEVIAWTWHETDGTFESVTQIPNETLGINEVWFVVKRYINGSYVRFIERMAPRDMGSDVADYVMLDCATSNNYGSPVPSASAGHLVGKTVNVLGDGNVIRGLTMGATYVTLPNGLTCTKIQVGLPYTSDVETLPIELQSQDGTSQGKRTTLPRATLRFWNSRGGYVRTTNQDTTVASTGVVGFDEVKQRNVSNNLAVAPPLETRDFLITLNGGYAFRTSILFRQIDPLPFCLTAVIPQIVQGGN